MRRQKRLIMLTGSVILLAAGVTAWLFLRPKPRPFFDAAEAIRQVQLQAPRYAIPRELFDLNSQRKALGVPEIGQDWAAAPTGLRIIDGPAIHVLVDGEGKPAKVILWDHGGLRGDQLATRSAWEQIAEYQVQDNRIAGLALIWAGAERRVERTEEYQKGRLETARYYSPAGDLIGSCSFRDGNPWDGRYIQRFDAAFTTGGSDVSYRKGKLHGEEREYANNGRPVRMRTFREGVLDGPARFYNDDGSLAHEYQYVDGVSRRHKAWCPDGQLQSETEFDAKGQQVGVEKKWAPDGTPAPAK